MAVILTPPYLQFFSNVQDGEVIPLAGGTVDTYAAGTTTRKATFTDNTGATQAPNPIQLNSSGIPETGNGNIWIFGNYKFVIKDSDGNEIRTVDNINSFVVTENTDESYFQSFAGNGTQTVFTLSEEFGTNEKLLMVFVDKGVNNIVTNGTFATDTGWTKGSGWSISAGAASATTASSALSQTSATTLVEGQAYSVTYTITASAGTVTVSVGGSSGTARSSGGTYREVIIAGSSQEIAFTGSGFSGTVDNVVISVASSAGFDILNPSQFTINADQLTFVSAPPAPSSGIANNIYIFAPSKLAGAAAASAAAADTSATNAAASAAAALASELAAAASAVTAAAQAAALTGTSTTSLAIAVASKVFTTQAGKQFGVGTYVLATSDANPANYMHGQVTAYSGTSLTVNVTNIGGSGTLADWTIRVSGTRGATGATGGPTADGDYGDITVTGSGLTWTIDNAVVTQAKLAAGIVAPAGWNYRNLRVVNNTSSPNTAVDITADEIILTDSSSNAYRALSASVSPDLLVSGVNGLDTGSEANSTWYYFWLIYNGTTVSSLFSLSATSPTLPSGYTYKACVGAVYNNSSGNLIRIKKFDKDVQYTVVAGTADLPVMASGSAGDILGPTWVALSTSAFVPPTAVAIDLVCLVNPTSTDANSLMVAPNSAYFAIGASINCPPVSLSSATAADLLCDKPRMYLESTSIYYASVELNGVVSIFCSGWKDSL